MTTTDTTTLTPCADEDLTGDNCYWNAYERGNGEGTSYVIRDGQLTQCAPGDILAEDFSCVGPDFYGVTEEEATVHDEVAEVPAEGPTDTIFIPETGEIVNESTGEVIEVVQSTNGVQETTTELALTGPEDLSPLTVILGLGALLLGLAIRRVARRA